MEDSKDFLAICVRCGSSQSLLHPSGNCCSCCHAVIIRCMITFHALPLIEFVPHASLKYEEALGIITKSSSLRQTENIFRDAIHSALSKETNPYHPVEVCREILESFDRSDVYVVKDSKGGTHYYKNMIHNVGIANCPFCCCVFHEQEFEYHCLKERGCPMCTVPVTENVSTDLHNCTLPVLSRRADFTQISISTAIFSANVSLQRTPSIISDTRSRCASLVLTRIHATAWSIVNYEVCEQFLSPRKDKVIHVWEQAPEYVLNQIQNESILRVY